MELKTNTKISCGCPNSFGAEPNTNVCPICAGFPGMLPVLNKRAVEFAIRAGLALNCEIASYCKFDRKNYFYPICPKPIRSRSMICPSVPTGIWTYMWTAKASASVLRAHLEEDAGKLVHQGSITETAFPWLISIAPVYPCWR